MKTPRGMEAPGNHAMSESVAEMVRETFEEIWNRRNLDLVEERFTADYVGHSIVEIRGREGVRDFTEMLLGAFPDQIYTVEDVVTEGDKVVLRWNVRATHRGPFQGLPPTGREVAISGIGIYRVEGDRIAEGWTAADMLGLMQQLGVIPPSDRE